MRALLYWRDHGLQFVTILDTTYSKWPRVLSPKHREDVMRNILENCIKILNFDNKDWILFGFLFVIIFGLGTTEAETDITQVILGTLGFCIHCWQTRVQPEGTASWSFQESMMTTQSSEKSTGKYLIYSIIRKGSINGNDTSGDCGS